MGFTIAVITTGSEFTSAGVMWVGSVMTVLLVALYLFVLAMHTRAVMRREILWDGMDEDVYVQEKKGKLTRLGREDIEAMEMED